MKKVGERRSEEKEEEKDSTEEELEKQFKRLKKKAPGKDGIPNEAWIYGDSNTKEKLKEIIRKVGVENGFPEDWKKAVITTLFKKGDESRPKNYWCISLLCTAYKIYASLLNDRLKRDIEGKGILPDTQAGFREKRRVIYNAYILQHIIEKETRRKRGKVYAMFVDLRAALDKVKRVKLRKAMEERGVRRGIRG